MSLENKYFTELAHRLQAAGITTGHPERNQLTVLLNDQPVLFVSSESDVFLLPAGSNPPEASELYHKVAQTAEEVYAYVEAIQTAPLLHASGLSEKFHLLADFGGAVLAGRELGNGWGYQFVTWIWDHDRTGVSHGHYYEEDFQGAKQDFAVRSGLISKAQLFLPEELTQLYRATDYAGYVSGKEATAYLPPALVAAMRGTVQDSENRIARLLFKLAVEVNMMMNVLAAGMEISDEDLKTLRARSVREVKQTNGRISFKDAIDYQRGVE